MSQSTTTTTCQTKVYTVMYGDFDVMGVFFDETAAYASIQQHCEPVGEDDVYLGDEDEQSDATTDVADKPEDDNMSYTVIATEVTDYRTTSTCGIAAIDSDGVVMALHDADSAHEVETGYRVMHI